MIYDLSSKLSRASFRVKCEQLTGKGARVELAEKRPKRTNQQNRYLHLILGWFALYSGYTRDYVKQEVFKRHVNSRLFLATRTNSRGETYGTLRSTSDVSTGELTTAIERFRDWVAQEWGVYLPEPNETDLLDELENELSRAEQYL